MSYFEDASLVLIPSAKKLSKIYAIKPTDGTGDLTFTRSSLKRLILHRGTQPVQLLRQMLQPIQMAPRPLTFLRMARSQALTAFLTKQYQQAELTI